MSLHQRHGVHRLEHRCHRRGVAGDAWRVDRGDLCRERGARRDDDAVPRGLEVHPRPRVAAFVERVVEQPRMPSHRHSPPRGLEIGLGRDRVLIIAQIIGDIGEHFDQSDVDIGGMLGGRVARIGGEVVEHQRAKRGIVLRQEMHVLMDCGSERIGHRHVVNVTRRSVCECTSR
ncbi:MAG: hypothetical protein E7773_07950 [Sphingomonas sp.]|nr:MAG: hypothetical protein E7773_07950 [Sphingomonas sp.]